MTAFPPVWHKESNTATAFSRDFGVPRVRISTRFGIMDARSMVIIPS